MPKKKSYREHQYGANAAGETENEKEIFQRGA
jgi:hypothetical protein